MVGKLAGNWLPRDSRMVCTSFSEHKTTQHPSTLYPLEAHANWGLKAATPDTRTNAA